MASLSPSRRRATRLTYFPSGKGVRSLSFFLLWVNTTVPTRERCFGVMSRVVSSVVTLQHQSPSMLRYKAKARLSCNQSTMMKLTRLMFEKPVGSGVAAFEAFCTGQAQSTGSYLIDRWLFMHCVRPICFLTSHALRPCLFSQRAAQMGPFGRQKVRDRAIEPTGSQGLHST
jgi:hypothetical protein